MLSLSLEERSANARLDACLDMNYRAGIDFNPFCRLQVAQSATCDARAIGVGGSFFPMNLGQGAIQIRLHLQT